MNNNEIIKLKKCAEYVRKTIEECQKLNPGILIGFPNGFCNVASIWLYEYLSCHGYDNITFRMRDPFLEQYDGNHVWLHWKSCDIDITADQFNKSGENFSSCIVSVNDEHYFEYDKEVSFRESFFCDYIPANKYDLQYDERIAVLNKLGVDPQYCLNTIKTNNHTEENK